jgi:hypothetical protein
MNLLDRVRAAAAGPRAAVDPAARGAGFDHVEMPSSSADKPNKRLTKPEFDSLPLQERVGLLVQGTLRFYRDDREIAASEAMRAAY